MSDQMKTKRTTIKHIHTLLAALFLVPLAALYAASTNSLETGFQSPPDSARPHTWWHWMNGNVTKEGIAKDLAAMKAVGIGGFQQVDAGLLAAGSVAYNSPRYHQLMSFAFAEADRLGLDAGFGNASGWSSTGGPWIMPENSMKTLVWSEVSVHAGDTSGITLPVPSIPPKFQAEGKVIKTDFYRDIVVLAFTTPKDNAYRIKDWQKKALLDPNSRADSFVPDFQPAPADAVIPAAKVMDLTNLMDDHGKLNWTPPAGNWTVVRLGYTSTGVMNRPASKAGQGLEVDKLSHKGTDVHWEKLINKIIADAQGRSSLKTILIDSYEVGMQNWTEDFVREFQARRGYDLIPHLLCVTGRVLDNTETTERVLWDLRSTVAELMAQNYYGYFAERCHACGLKLAFEPYGTGTFDAAASALQADIPMPEFWENNPRALWQWTAQVIPSAAHLSGRSIVGAESFTAINGDWKEHPYTLKKLGDWAFVSGVNRYYFHTFTHQPWNDAVKPGMTFHRFGGNFHRNNTWWPKSRAWMDYIARCQFVFQSGTFQADVLVLYGDERGFNNFLGPKEPVDMKELPGLHFDLGGMSSLDNLSVDANGDIRVSFGGKLLDTHYKMLLLKRADLMTPEHVAKLGVLADKGAKIFAPKPLRSPSLQNFPAADQKLQALVKRYWDTKLIHELGEFTAAVAALEPDCDVPEEVLFNHHHIGVDDFYFIANQQDKAREVTATFRVGGKQPELWNPLNGEITEAANWKALTDGRTEVSLSLTPVDSVFVVFRKPTASAGKTTPKTEFKELLSLNDKWTVTFDPNWGPKQPVAFDRLTPWNENTNDEIKYFSGTATYKTTFELPKQNARLVLDLGKVEVLARVTLNGKDLGTLWKPPFQVDATQVAKAGANQLEVEVTDLWVNRLIGDERFPNWGAGFPGWLTAGKAPPADAPRKTFEPMRPWKKSDPLVPSGLIGPVTLQTAVEIATKP